MISEPKVDSKNPDFNQKLPSYTISRGWYHDNESNTFFGKNDGNTVIDRKYWENAITVQNYLERIASTDVFENALHDQIQFKKLLVKLHVQQSQGLLRNNEYGGQSEEMNLSANWQKEFRSPNFKVTARATVESTRELQNLCNSLDSDNWGSSELLRENVATLASTIEGELFSSPLDMYFPPSVLLENPIGTNTISETVNEILIPGSPTSKQRSSICALFINSAFYTGKLDKTNPNYLNEDILVICYPSATYIPVYLEITRVNLVNTLEAQDEKAKVRYLARAYQAAIRSQAFETVWNSECMGLVNFFLKKYLNLKPIAHGYLDYKAFMLSPEAFEEYFTTFVNHFNDLTPVRT